LINTGKVVSFIDNVIMGMEKKEEHDKVVEEVVRRLVIGPEGIKMEQKNVKGVLD